MNLLKTAQLCKDVATNTECLEPLGHRSQIAAYLAVPGDRSTVSSQHGEEIICLLECTGALDGLA